MDKICSVDVQNYDAINFVVYNVHKSSYDFINFDCLKNYKPSAYDKMTMQEKIILDILALAQLLKKQKEQQKC